MKKLSNKVLTSTILGIIYLVGTFGFVGPYLLSLDNDLAVLLGFIVVLILPAYVAINLANKFFFNNSEKHEETL